MGDAIIETIEHSKRVSKLVEVLRDDLIELYKYYNRDNIDNEIIYKSLYMGGLVHDIGKFIMPSKIILKRGCLTDLEYRIMKAHTIYGLNLIDKCTDINILCNNEIDIRIIKNIVLNHHEKVDGTGYPRHLTKDNIPIEARIISVLDSLDAMTSYRGYNRVMHIGDSLNELRRCCNTQFDEDVVKIVQKLGKGEQL